MYRDEHGIMHFEDDGGPPVQERPLRIGILNASGNPVDPPASLLSVVPLPAPEPEPTPLDWPTYCTWRETKCRPYDLVNGPKLASCADETRLGTAAIGGPFISKDRALEEIDQATHELVGEVAELAELVMRHGPYVFRGEACVKFIDECGDILFCGAWALDAWGDNPCRTIDTGGTELVECDGEWPMKVIGGMIRSGRNLNDAGEQNFMAYVMTTLCELQSFVGLTSNAFKKLRFQRRQQDVATQRDRILHAFANVNALLIIAGSSIDYAMLVNQRKLNARYPDGYVHGMGGGIRTGDGA